MTVAIPCTACAQNVPFGSRACPTCGHPLSSDERAALEARFEAMNADYREAKMLAFRGLAAALVAGLMTVTIAGIRVMLTSDANVAISPMSWISVAAGLALVAVWFVRHRVPTLALAVALAIWSGTLALPLLLAPAAVLLGLASAGGVALTLARFAVFLLLVRGLAASIQIGRMLGKQT